jgi:hypothetical protein
MTTPFCKNFTTVVLRIRAIARRAVDFTLAWPLQ